MQCPACFGKVKDGIECAKCSRHLHFRCAHVAQKQWEELPLSRRLRWECVPCRMPTTSYIRTVHIVLREIRQMKKQYALVPSLYQTVATVKLEIEAMRYIRGIDHDMITSLCSKQANLMRRLTKMMRINCYLRILESYVERMGFLMPSTSTVRARHYDRVLQQLMERLPA